MRDTLPDADWFNDAWVRLLVDAVVKIAPWDRQERYPVIG
jgi:hypothetical protein